MVFVFAKDDRGLVAFASIEDAIAKCEGVDVEDGNYSFFAGDGSALHPRFTGPNDRGSFTVRSGTYVLEPDAGSDAQRLAEILAHVTYVTGCGLGTVEDVKHALSADRRALRAL